MDASQADLVIAVFQEALKMTLKLSLPLLGVGLVVGLIVSLFQAMTQIQEQTLAFIPKILAVVGALLVLLPTMLSLVVSYTGEMLNSLDFIHVG